MKADAADRRGACWVLTPIKAPQACKTRLAPALGETARRALVAQMLAHVAEVARAAPGVDEFVLLGPSRHGLPDTVRLLADPGGGLNAALSAGLAAAIEARVARLVILAGDLPRLRAADLTALLAVEAGSIALAPDRKEDGTNALSLPLPAARTFRFQYGHGSFAAHSQEAKRLGLSLQVIRSDSLGLDVDEPADLAAVAQS